LPGLNKKKRIFNKKKSFKPEKIAKGYKRTATSIPRLGENSINLQLYVAQ
jgi:hypothetical protein